MQIYHATRSKKLVNMLSNLHLSIPYHKVMVIRQSLFKKIKEKIDDNDGVYTLTSISPNKPLFFAIDNIDLTIDTPDGKDQLHGTTQVVFQERDLDFHQTDLKIDRDALSSKGAIVQCFALSTTRIKQRNISKFRKTFRYNRNKYLWKVGFKLGTSTCF